MKQILMTVMLAGAVALSGEAAMKFNRLFGDHAVLQREKPVRVWGTGATPGEIVEATLGSVKGYTRANTDGSFRVLLPAQKAGGPYQLVATDVKSGGSVASEDVYLGEVWVCSGQSNMEFRMKSARPGAENRDYPEVRMFTVPRSAAFGPVHEAAADWKLATVENVPAFSAVGFFFADVLSRRLGCKVGMIHSSWGGTPVEAWTPREKLMADPVDAAKVLDYERRVNDPALWKLAAEVTAHNANPEGQAPLDPGIADFTRDWGVAPLTADWKAVTLPASFFATFKREFNGAVWYRRTVELPAEFAGRDLELHLGAVDKMDVSFFNGEKVGATGSGRETKYWDALRVYPVPARLVKAGPNVIAVRVWSQIHAGQMSGPENEMYLAVKGGSQKIPLADAKWYARIERDVGFTFRHSGSVSLPGNPNSPHTLFDGMIEPILGCGIRGAIWYQGESNAALAQSKYRYGEQMASMITGWRERWGSGDFPFIQVELASFMPARSYEEESPWGKVRFGQLYATRICPNVGLASALDVGEFNDIHPKDKLTVGSRLARWAFANVYGLEKVACGPRYLDADVVGAEVRVRFTDVGGGLVVRGGGEVKPCGVIDAKGEFHAATGRLDGETLVISAPDVPNPVRACYGWAANPLGLNLFNAEGLPATPFMTGR